MDAVATTLRPALAAAATALRPTAAAAAAALRSALAALPPPATVYTTATRVVALPGWAVLAAAAAAGGTPRPRGIAAHLVLPLVLALSAVYVTCMAAALVVDELPPTDLGTLADLRTAFGTSDWLLTAGWVHYLALDLLLGLGVFLDASRRRGGRGGVAWRAGLLGCLVVVCALAPAGVLLYALFRTVVGREEEAPAAGAAAGNKKDN